MRSLWRQTALLAATGAFSAICSVAARSSSTAQSQLVEALSDYAVVALPGSARLAFLGGRLISPDKDHEDDFLGFEAVPVLDTEDLSWSTKVHSRELLPNAVSSPFPSTGCENCPDSLPSRRSCRSASIEQRGTHPRGHLASRFTSIRQLAAQSVELDL